MSKSEEVETFVQAELYITSRHLTPAQISERLSIQPTRVHLKGQPLFRGARDPSNSFVLQVRHLVRPGTPRFSAESSSEMLKVAIEELLQKIEPVADRLDSMREQVSTDLMCTYGSLPKPEWFYLPEDLVRRLAALKLSVTVFLATLKGEKLRMENEGDAQT